MTKTMAESKHMNSLMSSSEMQVIDLKKEINILLKELGRAAKFGRVHNEDI